EAHDAGVTREEVRLLMLAWSRFDPRGALAWARAWPTQWKTTLSEEAAYSWGFRDAPAAMREVEEVDDEELRERLRHALVEGWVHGPDRARAGEYIASLSDPRQRQRLSFLLAGETMVDGPDALVAWAEAVPVDAPNDFKRGSFVQSLGMVARADPARAGRWW